MAESNSPRFGIRRWGASSDTFSRSELDGSFGQLELLGAIDKQDTFANRPTAGTRGTYFWDTTNTVLWRDNGSAWFVVGSKVLDGLAKGSTAASVPFTVDTFGAAQSVNVMEVKNNAVNILTVSPAGNLAAAGTFQAKSAVLSNATDAAIVLDLVGSASQSANMLRLRSNGGTNLFQVTSAGAITSTYLTSNASAAIVGGSTPTSVANAGVWSGNAALEVKMPKSGFYDFLYLNHPDPAPNTAASRRIGMMMKVGAEDAAAYTRSAVISLRSYDANFDNPQLVLEGQGQELWTMRPNNTDGSRTPFPVFSTNGYFKAVPNGDAAFHASNTKIGTQDSGNAMYFRVPDTANQFSWYAGGTHDDTLNAPGSGGQQWMTLNVNRLVTGRLQLTANNDAYEGTTYAPLTIGMTNDQHILIDNNEILAVNNGVLDTAQLMLQTGGGRLDIGSHDTRVYQNGHRIHVGQNAPTDIENVMVWIRPHLTNSLSGVYYRNGSSWIRFAT